MELDIQMQIMACGAKQFDSTELKRKIKLYRDKLL